MITESDTKKKAFLKNITMHDMYVDLSVLATIGSNYMLPILQTRNYWIFEISYNGK